MGRASSESMPPVVARALKVVNQAYAEVGQPPIPRLLSGTSYQTDCPIQRSLRCLHLGPNMRVATHHVKGLSPHGVALLRRAWGRHDERSLKRVWYRRDAVRLPNDLVRFICEFDEGNLPELIQGNVPVLTLRA